MPTLPCSSFISEKVTFVSVAPASLLNVLPSTLSTTHVFVDSSLELLNDINVSASASAVEDVPPKIDAVIELVKILNVSAPASPSILPPTLAAILNISAFAPPFIEPLKFVSISNVSTFAPPCRTFMPKNERYAAVLLVNAIW